MRGKVAGRGKFFRAPQKYVECLAVCGVFSCIVFCARPYVLIFSGRFRARGIMPRMRIAARRQGRPHRFRRAPHERRHRNQNPPRRRSSVAMRRRPAAICGLYFLALSLLQAQGQPLHEPQQPEPLPLTLRQTARIIIPSAAAEHKTIIAISKGPIICVSQRYYSLLPFLLFNVSFITPLLVSTMSAVTAEATASQIKSVHHHVPIV